MALSVNVDVHQIAAEIKSFGRHLGFDLVGIASAEPSHYRDYFRQWLDDGQAGSMGYLQKRFDERTDPAIYVPGARSVVCVAMNYHVPLEELSPADQKDQARIARYALGDDYHDVLKARLHILADKIRELAPEARTRAAVDTAPVMEKELAARAGIGWLGKNTCIINEEIGSWIFLGEVISTLALPPDEPAVDRCGTCTRCIDACPTHAITEPYQLDARRCISYLNIEHRTPLDQSIGGELANWLYGCDICQDVCPWNKRAPDSADSAFKPRFPSGTIDLRQLLQWNDEQYRTTLRGSAMKRVKLPILQHNARLLMESSRSRE
jgi:epoxyqueuosine reductase